MINIKTRHFFLVFLVESILLFSSLYIGAEPLLAITLMIWVLLFAKSFIEMRENIAVLCFLISFFVFLLGREVCFTYFNLDRYYLYLEKYNKYTFFLLMISLLSLAIGTLLGSSKIRFTFGDMIRNEKKSEFLAQPNNKYQQMCKYVYYFCYVVSIIYIVDRIVFIRPIGYAASYIADDSGAVSSGPMGYIASFAFLALCLYLSTLPEKKTSIRVLCSYEIYAALTLLTGKRYTFIAISMFIVIYFFIRDRLEGGWISKKYVILVIIAIPILLILLMAIDSTRENKNFNFTGIIDTNMKFLDQQGGSINNIKRIQYYKDALQDMSFVSFSNLRSVLFENIIMRNIFPIKVYAGNSVEHALMGNSLAHRLSYYQYASYYLTGHGVGSCYIAELYMDFGFIGVILGNIVYGYLLKKISCINFSRGFKDALLLAMIYYLLLAPRGSFDGFVGGIFNLYSILGIIVIVFVADIAKKGRKSE